VGHLVTTFVTQLVVGLIMSSSLYGLVRIGMDAQAAFRRMKARRRIHGAAASTASPFAERAAILATRQREYKALVDALQKDLSMAKSSAALAEKRLAFPLDASMSAVLTWDCGGDAYLHAEFYADDGQRQRRIELQKAPGEVAARMVAMLPEIRMRAELLIEDEIRAWQIPALPPAPPYRT